VTVTKTEFLRRGTIGYSCTPDIREADQTLAHATIAAKSDFGAIWVSDHFHPWAHTGAKEYSTWIWMTAALATTKSIPFGTAVTAPLFRYHPAIVAQAFATMELMFGSRLILGIGTGEAMNEVPLGFPWPRLKERRERLVEAVKIMRSLFVEDFVSFKGKYYTLNNASLYMKSHVPIFISGFGPKMARIAGEIGDGFITMLKPLDYVKSVLFSAVKEGARASGKSFEEITKVIELDVSYDEDYNNALKPLRFWAATLLPEMFTEPISDPREIEERGKKVTDSELAGAFVVGTSSEQFVKAIEDAFRSGFDHVYVQSSSPDELKFLRMFDKQVLPNFKERQS
jgi:coenzyme F420-dependent glucose-6-phosphate dehydrogenase